VSADQEVEGFEVILLKELVCKMHYPDTNVSAKVVPVLTKTTTAVGWGRRRDIVPGIDLPRNILCEWLVLFDVRYITRK
jgi:hypothetical protein